MSNTVAEIIDDDIKILQVIRKEIVPKCKPPKKMELTIYPDGTSKPVNNKIGE